MISSREHKPLNKTETASTLVAFASKGLAAILSSALNASTGSITVAAKSLAVFPMQLTLFAPVAAMDLYKIEPANPLRRSPWQVLT